VEYSRALTARHLRYLGYAMLGWDYASDLFDCQHEVLLYSFVPLGGLLFASAQPHLGACRAIVWMHTLAVYHHVWRPLYSFVPLDSLLFASTQPHLGACRAIVWVHTLAVCHHVWQRGHV
jgi:hypothetical protein